MCFAIEKLLTILWLGISGCWVVQLVCHYGSPKEKTTGRHIRLWNYDHYNVESETCCNTVNQNKNNECWYKINTLLTTLSLLINWNIGS